MVDKIIYKKKCNKNNSELVIAFSWCEDIEIRILDEFGHVSVILKNADILEMNNRITKLIPPF